MHFVINGASFESEIDPRASVLDLLRDRAGLHGAKKGCSQGACGASGRDDALVHAFFRSDVRRGTRECRHR